LGLPALRIKLDKTSFIGENVLRLKSPPPPRSLFPLLKLFIFSYNIHFVSKKKKLKDGQNLREEGGEEKNWEIFGL